MRPAFACLKIVVWIVWKDYLLSIKGILYDVEPEAVLLR